MHHALKFNVAIAMCWPLWIFSAIAPDALDPSLSRARERAYSDRAVWGNWPVVEEEDVIPGLDREAWEVEAVVMIEGG